MKYNIFNYNQQGAISLGLDLKDLLILDWFQTFQPRMSTTIHENEQYYWVSYKAVLEDIPIIEIKTTKGLYKRLQKLCEIGILKHHTKTTNAGSYSYYLITDMIGDLISSESSFASPESSFASPESSAHNNSSTINSSTINKKAIASSGLSFQKNIEDSQKKENEISKDIISLDEFRDLWLEIKGDVNLDKVGQKYDRCINFYHKKKNKTGFKNYAKDFISKEDKRFDNNQEIPFKPSTNQKEGGEEVIEYKEPQVIEIPLKKEFEEVCKQVEKVVDSNFLFNHYISCAVADVSDDKITIYNNSCGLIVGEARVKAEQRASAMIKEILKKPNITIEFVYKKAIRVIND